MLAEEWMSLMNKAGRVASLAVAGCLMIGTQLQAAPSRHQINAKAVGGPAAPEPPYAFCTDADVIGGGLLNGTTHACFNVIGFTPPTQLDFKGPLTFTTAQGTLTVLVTGAVDVITRDFTGSGPVVGSTG